MNQTRSITHDRSDDEFLDYYQARMAQEGRATDLGWQGDVMSLYQNDPGALDDLVADFAQTKVGGTDPLGGRSGRGSQEGKTLRQASALTMRGVYAGT